MKKAVISLLFLLAIYYFLLLLFGPSSLAKQLVRDSNSTYYEFLWTNKIMVIGNVDVNEISKFFNKHGNHVSTVLCDDYDCLRNQFFENETYAYILFVDSGYSPWITVDEVERIEDYAASWEKQYIWFFGFWIRIKNEMTGIS